MTEKEILQFAQSFMESRILHAAAELDLFTALARAPLSATEVATKIGAAPRPLTVLLDAVAALGFLTKKGQTYQCEGSVARLLASGSPESILPMVLHMSHLWTRWARLPDVAKGIPVSEDAFDFVRDTEELRAVVEGFKP